MNVHIRSRPYKCRADPNCGSDFNELANRNAHEKNVHQFDYKKMVAADEGDPGAEPTVIHFTRTDPDES